MTPATLEPHLRANRARGAVAVLQLLDHVDALDHLATGADGVLADDLRNLAQQMRDTLTDVRRVVIDPEVDGVLDRG